MAGVIEVMARLSGNSAGMVSAFAEGGRAAQGMATTAEAANARVVASHEAASKAVRTAGLVTAAAIVGVSLVATDMAADFEKSTMRLVTSGGMTKDTLKTVKDGILDISKSTGYTASALADGMYTVSAAGYNTASGLDILKAAAQGAAAEGTDLQVMVGSLTTIMSTYHLKEDQVVGTTNQLVAASGLAKGTMQEFAGSLSTVLPVASAAGISFADIGGAMSVMTNKGTSAQQATQELRNAITNLQAPNQVAVKEMSQLGINSMEVSQKLGERGLSGTLKYLSEKVLSASDDGMVLLGTFKQSEQAGQAMATMLGSMDGELKTLSTSLSKGEISTKDYNIALNKMDSNSSNMGHQFETLWKKSTGFSDALKSGTPAAQTYVQALEKMMGGQTGLQVALQLTGGSMGQYEDAMKTVSEAAGKNSDEVYTNADSQSTLTAQLNRTKAEFGAMMIQLGTYLIPAFHDLLDGVMSTVHWFQEHETTAKVLGIALGGLAGFVLAYTVQQWAANAAILAFPGTWIVVALAGLAVAFTAAYDNIGWFKDAVDTSFGELKRFGEQLSESWKTSTGLLAGFFTDVTKNLTDFQGSSLKFADEVKANLQKFQDGAKKFTDDTKGMFSDFNTNTKGMFDDMVKNVTTWNTQTKGMFDDFWKHVGEGWAGFWKDPIGETQTFFDKTSEALGVWSEATSKSLNTWMDTTGTGFRNWNKDASKNVNEFLDNSRTNFQTWNEQLSKNIHEFFTGATQNTQTWSENTSKSITENHATTGQSFAEWNKTTSANLLGWATNQKGGFREWNTGVSGMVGDFKTNTEGMFNDWNKNVSGTFGSWHDNLTGKTRSFVDDTSGMILDFNKNTIGMFTDFNRNTKGMFDDMFKHVGDGWNGLREAAAGPVRFIVNTVYNDGIKAAWNAVNNGLGLGLALPDAHFSSGGVVGRGMAKFATGGIMPGYSPGVDNHVIAVGGGEAIMRPEWTRAVGADKIHAMNAMAAAGNMGGVQSMMGLRGFAGGGIVDDIMSNLGSFFSNPLGGLQDALKPFTAMLSQTGGGNWGKMMNQFPLKIMGALGDKIGGLFSASHPAPTGGDTGSPGTGGVGGTGQWSGLVSQALGMLGQPGSLLETTLRRMNQESGGNANAINNWDSNAAAGIPSKGLMQVIDPTFRSYAMPGYNSNIYDPLSNILASMRYAISRYGSLAGAYNQPGGYSTGGIVPTFDSGGILGPGLNLVNNATGAPEHLSNTTGLAGATIVLEIPELGGRMIALVKHVSRDEVAGAFSTLAQTASGTPGTSKGVYV